MRSKVVFPLPVFADYRDHLPGLDLKIKPGQHLSSAKRLADSSRC
jgi:hypothetical protein